MEVEAGVVFRVGGDGARHCGEVRSRGFAAYEDGVRVDVELFRVLFEPRERLIDVLYGLGVRVEGRVPVIEADDKIARFRDAGVEGFPGLREPAYPSAAVDVDKDGGFDAGVAVLALVDVEIELSVAVHVVVHLPLDLDVQRAAGVEHGEETEQFVFGVSRAHVGELDVVEELFLKRFHVVDGEFGSFHVHSASVR